jgi:hypothetical protein
MTFINSWERDVFGSRRDHPNPSQIGALAQQELFQWLKSHSLSA